MSVEVFGWVVALVAVAGAVLAVRRERRRLDAARYEAARTARDQADLRSELAAERGRFEALTRATWDGVLIADADGRVVYLNEPLRALFEMPAGSNQSVIAVTRDAEVAQLVSDTLGGRQALIRQVVLDGHTFRARAVPFGEDSRAGVAVVFEDVSELQRLSRARRDFVANISHELRNPLASIRLLAETLLGGALEQPELARRLAGKIGVETDVLSQLAQELLDLAQIESGQSLMRMVPTPLRDVVETTMARLAPQAEQKGVSLRSATPPDLVVLADADQVARVIANLVHNAIKFTPPGGAVAVGAGAVRVSPDRPAESLTPGSRPPDGALPEGDWAVVEIRDSGIGIPARDLPRIFERFYKGDQARLRNRGGTGLGLAIARHIVEGHGGHIWAESVEGQGATFCFSLPLADSVPDGS